MSASAGGRSPAERGRPAGGMPFGMKRMIYGGFEPLFGTQGT